MRRSARSYTPALAVAALLAAGQFTTVRAQDPDDMKRGVARISLINGDVSVQRGDSGEVVAAAVNAPLAAQDHIITGPSSRAEIQLDSSNVMRLGANAEVGMAELEYRRFILQLARGTATFRVLRDSTADVEVDTPNVSVRPSRRGTYRIAVHEDGQTDVTVRAGDVEVFTPRGTQQIHNGQTLMVRGTASDPEFQMVSAGPYDDWDRWNDARDQPFERSVSTRYVSPDVYGAEDLDPYGQWIYDAPYGNVWRPQVAAGWAPYQAGRWVWLDWYGWTWVSSDPWGWAPYHYGRWYSGPGGWCWYPGGIGGRHYWSPALVGFFGFGHGGGIGVGFGWGNVGWVPLAPYERFSPWWGRNYYGGYRNGGYIDRSVNITNNVNISNIYRNARVANGVTAVNASDFSQGRFNNHARYSGADLSQASAVRGPLPAAPGAAHMRFSDRQASNVAAARTPGTSFFSHRQADPVERVPFAQQQQSLARISRIPVQQYGGGRSANPAGPIAGGGQAPVGRGAASDNTGRGWQGFGGTRQAGQASSQPATQTGQNAGGGWRRFGDTTAQPGRAAQSAQPSAAPTPRNGGSGSGWNRFGDTTAQPGRAAQSAQPSATPAPRSGGSGSGWNRFGDTTAQPGRAPQPAQPSVAPAPRNGGSGSGWNRFGDPSSSAPRYADRAAPNMSSGNPGSGNSGGRGWNRFGDPSAAPRSSAPPQSARPQPQSYSQRSQPSVSAPAAPRYSAPRQESIRMSAPVVRERSAAPSRPSGGGGGGGSSRGAPSGGGGGGSHHGGRNR